ncbi:MAG: MarR family winged helix-turn-helix transcriptional regulator [Sphingobium sp.]
MDTPPPAPPLTDPVAHRLGYLLRRASATMMADLGKALTAFGVSPVEATVLAVIGVNPGCTQSDIARLIGIKRANMVPIISRLHAEGLIDKTPMNGRSHALALTARGEQCHRSVETAMDRHEARFEAMLAGRDVAHLRETLALMVQPPGD